MNLRRILQSITLFVLLVLGVNHANAQTAQLAGVTQEGLIQLGSNHPFVVNNYVIDLTPLNVSSASQANQILGIYSSEGFISFTYDMQKKEAAMTIDPAKIADRQLTVEQMNEKLRMIHRIKR